MQLREILLVASGGWVVMLVLVLSLCRVAKRSDDETAMTVTDTSVERQLRGLGLDHAATLLGISPHTLLVWQVRYGFPTSSPAELRYNQTEVLALRDSLEDGLSISSAVIRAREQTRRRRATAVARQLDHRDGGIAS